MLQIPLDVILLILDNSQNQQLAQLCRVSKLVHCHASKLLYRKLSPIGSLSVCKTLISSPRLATEVKSLYISSDSFLDSDSCGDEVEWKLLADALQCVISLHTLELHVSGRYSWTLVNAPFKLAKFYCSMVCDTRLITFLRAQRSIHTLTLIRDYNPRYANLVDRSMLPVLMSIEAPSSWLSVLIPGRPVREVTCEHLSAPFDVKLLAASSSNVRSLSTNLISLQAVSADELTSLASALRVLYIGLEHPIRLAHKETNSLQCWLALTIPSLIQLERLTLKSSSSCESFSWSDDDERTFVKRVAGANSSQKLRTVNLECEMSPARCTTWQLKSDTNNWCIQHRVVDNSCMERAEKFSEYVLKAIRASSKAKWPPVATSE